MVGLLIPKQPVQDQPYPRIQNVDNNQHLLNTLFEDCIQNGREDWLSPLLTQ